jgi:hypothetical protein
MDEREFREIVDYIVKYNIPESEIIEVIESLDTTNIDLNKPMFDSDAYMNGKLRPLMFVIYHIFNVDKTFLFVKKFIEEGADPNLPSESLKNHGYTSSTPLLWLIEENDPNSVFLIEYLLAYGANPFKQDNIDLIDFINSDDSLDQVKLKKLINKYRYIYKMQRRRRRNLTYKKKKRQLANKNLALSKLLDTYDVDEPLTRDMRRETIRSIMNY